MEMKCKRESLNAKGFERINMAFVHLKKFIKMSSNEGYLPVNPTFPPV